MYIEQITIRNVRLIRDQTISFMRGDNPRMWTVIIGENGACKTTILQAIALAALGPDGANRITSAGAYPSRLSYPSDTFILSQFYNDSSELDRDDPIDVRRGSDKSSALRIHSAIGIPIDWEFFAGGSRRYRGHSSEYSSWLPKSQSDDSDLMESILLSDIGGDPIRKARALGLPGWLVTGYGPTRTLAVPKTIDEPDSNSVERLQSLFQPKQIVGSGFADLLPKHLVEPYVKRLKEALLKQPSILPRIAELEVRGQDETRSTAHLLDSHRFRFSARRNASSADRRNGGLKVPATWLSQGYQAMIAWIADLIGQFFLDEGRDVPLDEMEGLVLIDELDMHLHPTWQRGLITALKETFPRVQFVVTTHTAMVLPGLEADEILRTRFDEEGNVVVEPVGVSPDFLTGSEILSTFYGIDSLYPSEIGEKLQRYGYLAGNPTRSDEEEAEVHRIRGELATAGVVPGFDPIPRKPKPRSNGKRSSARSRKGQDLK